MDCIQTMSHKGIRRSVSVFEAFLISYCPMHFFGILNFGGGGGGRGMCSKVTFHLQILFSVGGSKVFLMIYYQVSSEVSEAIK